MKLADRPLIVLPVLIIVIAAGFYIAVTRGCQSENKPVPLMKGKPVTWLCEDDHIFIAPIGPDVRSCEEPDCDAQAYMATLFECLRKHDVWVWFKPSTRECRYFGGAYDWESFERFPDGIPPCPHCGTSLAPAPPE